ncbi:sporulation protein SpoOM, partial [[Clostridium] innocuum]|nr:sporulation protein SpoOM [[Clostridium] innocuum]MCC2851688.1 sporulation protein SpoOM [[Clostridium] innocuum]MCC2855822.1 sporulation protein SpoOM [[Clostridium] innocuum]
EEGLIPTGTLKREWIAMDTGFSARSVQDYLNLLEEHPNKEKKESRSSKYEDIQNTMHDVLKLPVKITDKQISIKIKDDLDLARVLELLGVENL